MKTISITEAELLACKFRSQTGISLTDPISVKTLIRKLGITLVYRPLSDTSYGISCKSNSGKMFILVNSTSTRGRQHFTIAHELYHLFYDENPVPHLCSVQSSVAEKNANRFASALLMPKEGILNMVSSEDITVHKVSLASVLRMEQFFGTSRTTLLYRLKDLNLITQDKVDELKRVPVKDSAREYGYDLSLYNPGNEGVVISDFGEKARLLYEKEVISEGHYQELLNMIIYDQKQN